MGAVAVGLLRHLGSRAAIAVGGTQPSSELLIERSWTAFSGVRRNQHIFCWETRRVSTGRPFSPGVTIKPGLADVHLEVWDDELVVSLPGTIYVVTYYKPANSPWLRVRNFPSTNDGQHMTTSGPGG
jgi:hypothetical protein